jgi:hypothetical protein
MVRILLRHSSSYDHHRYRHHRTYPYTTQLVTQTFPQQIFHSSLRTINFLFPSKKKRSRELKIIFVRMKARKYGICLPAMTQSGLYKLDGKIRKRIHPYSHMNFPSLEINHFFIVRLRYMVRKSSFPTCRRLIFFRSSLACNTCHLPTCTQFFLLWRISVPYFLIIIWKEFFYSCKNV